MLRGWTKMNDRLCGSLFLLLLFCQCIDSEKLKLCVVETVHTAKNIRRFCPQLDTPQNSVECVIGNDRFNCLRRLTTGTADFTVLEPEDLVAASGYREYNILVTNELRLFRAEKERFTMVVLVNKDVKSIWNLKGKRFCHPGLDTTDEWTKAFSTYFDKWIVTKECNPEKTLLEDRMFGLSNFFEAACIAGPWSPDATFDNKLKSKYRNLCGACDNPLGCYSDDKYHGREGALLCLTDNAGDIAWVRLDDVIEHFKEEHINKDNYNYLCLDGTTRSLKSTPCPWITRPWPVIVARTEVAEKVDKMMTSSTQQHSTWILDLLENYQTTPVSIDSLETPEDFLVKFSGFMSANNRAKCRPSRRVQWCVASNLEDRKCRWLREASFVYGVEPSISCKQESSRAACLRAIKNNQADIFVALPQELYEVRKMGLETLVQAVPKKANQFDRIAAVVKQDSRFKSFKDLRGARACFTGYKDVGWYTFLSILKNITGGRPECSGLEAVGNFFAESVVPGLDDSQETIPSNLHTTAGNVGDDASAFRCLESDNGDVAFINIKNIQKKIGNLKSEPQDDHPNNTSYRTLCLKDSDEADVCTLAWFPLNAVVVHENLTEVRREDMYMMLLEMNDLFGTTFKGQVPTFSMYGTYDNNSNIIFSGETQNLQMDVHQMHTRSYKDIIDHLVKQSPCSGSRNTSYLYGYIISIYVLIHFLKELLHV
ncbi:transferrin 3 isoform X1 [Halictus rubicundus]|uniref:transferrin 3 isoform X1 n=1 Tax=Halictus rubicundus TaxID=77578 RepID=UPI0040354A3E